MPWKTFALVAFGAGAVVGVIRKEWTACCISAGLFFLHL